MMHLNVECLEGRALMAAGLMATATPAPEPVTDVAARVVTFTPPTTLNSGGLVGVGLGGTGARYVPVNGICAVWHD